MQQVNSVDAYSATFPSLPSVLVRDILLRLDVDDLLSVSQTCRTLKTEIDDDSMWECVARRTFPHSSLIVNGQSYQSFKQLVLNKNKRYAGLGVDLGSACHWFYNQTSMYYQCKLLHFEVTPGPEVSFRLYFDARGESDLRRPETSTLAIVSHVPSQSPDPSAPPETSWELSRLPRDVMLSPAPSRRLSAALNGRTAIVQGAQYPDAVHHMKARPGHFKGGLQWNPSSVNPLIVAMDSPIQTNSNSNAGTTSANSDPGSSGIEPGCSDSVNTIPGQAPNVHPGRVKTLVFSYANNLCSKPHDYTNVPLLHVPDGSDFHQSWQQLAKYCTKGEMERSLREEDDAQERARWLPSLHPQLLQPGRDWWRPYVPSRPSQWTEVERTMNFDGDEVDWWNLAITLLHDDQAGGADVDTLPPWDWDEEEHHDPLTHDPTAIMNEGDHVQTEVLENDGVPAAGSDMSHEEGLDAYPMEQVWDWYAAGTSAGDETP